MIPSILCFIFMLDVLVLRPDSLLRLWRYINHLLTFFVKQHKLIQYIVWIESIFFCMLYNS